MIPDKMPGTSADLSALSELCTPWCIHVVATLRIADHLAAGTADIQTLAEEAKCNADSLQQVLRHLTSKGVFAELTPGRFALNEAAQGLLPTTSCSACLSGKISKLIRTSRRALTH